MGFGNIMHGGWLVNSLIINKRSVISESADSSGCLGILSCVFEVWRMLKNIFTCGTSGGLCHFFYIKEFKVKRRYSL